MRILHVVCSDRFAGVEQFVLRLACAQAAAGHDVYVAGGSPDAMRAPLAAAGARFTPAAGAYQAFRAVRSARFDVVASHMTDADAATALALAADRRTAHVSTRHFAQPRRRFGPLHTDRLLGRIDAEIAISQVVADATGLPATVVHTGVPDAAQAGFEPRVLMVQRLQPEKRTDVGIRAFAASGLAGRGWRLDIVGDGAERPALAELIDDQGLTGRARLLGFHDDVAQVLAEGGIFLAPCPVEGLGIAVLEAMAHGLAVVAADAAGHQEILAGLDTRARFRPDDVADAARALRALAEDEPGRARLGTACQQRQRAEFSVPAQVAATEQVYRAAIERRQR